MTLIVLFFRSKSCTFCCPVKVQILYMYIFRVSQSGFLKYNITWNTNIRFPIRWLLMSLDSLKRRSTTCTNVPPPSSTWERWNSPRKANRPRLTELPVSIYNTKLSNTKIHTDRRTGRGRRNSWSVFIIQSYQIQKIHTERRTGGGRRNCWSVFIILKNTKNTHRKANRPRLTELLVSTYNTKLSNTKTHSEKLSNTEIH